MFTVLGIAESTAAAGAVSLKDMLEPGNPVQVLSFEKALNQMSKVRRSSCQIAVVNPDNKLGFVVHMHLLRKGWCSVPCPDILGFVYTPPPIDVLCIGCNVRAVWAFMRSNRWLKRPTYFAVSYKTALTLDHWALRRFPEIYLVEPSSGVPQRFYNRLLEWQFAPTVPTSAYVKYTRY